MHAVRSQGRKDDNMTPSASSWSGEGELRAEGEGGV